MARAVYWGVLHRAAKIPWGWAVVAVAATVLGLASLRYALPIVSFPSELPNFRLRHGWLVVHAICAAIALLAGPWQFARRLRNRSLRTHRWVGRIYCAAVGAGWVASVPIAAHANTGSVASAGFLVLGALWAGTTLFGYFSIRRGLVQTHREWMMRSYAVSAAAITFRLYLPLLAFVGIRYPANYPIATWACFIPNLVFAEWLIRRGAGAWVLDRRLRAVGLGVPK